MDLFDNQPIIACSSGGMQRAAIALLRLSGFESFSQIKSFFSIEDPVPKRATFCHLLEGTKVIDQVVLTYFKGPNSYTGENLLELGVHGNHLNVQRIVEIFMASDIFRLAHPGEFSYRAWKNNKITLSELEGLDIFLNAPSRGVLDQAAKLMGGELTQVYLNLRERFLELKASVELSLDFLEDVGEVAAQESLKECLENFGDSISALYAKTQGSISGVMAPDIVLTGKPNAGKSSLFNSFLKGSRSIVAPEAGTTRDYVSEYLYFRETQFRLIDTAGVREMTGGVEQEGIVRAIRLVRQAFYKILLIDPRVFRNEDMEVFEGVHFDLILLTHVDIEDRGLPPGLSLGFDYYGKISLKSGPIGPREVEIFSNRGGSIGPDSSGSIEPGGGGPIGPGRGLETIFELVLSKYLNLLKEDQIMVARQRMIIHQSFKKFQEVKKLVGESDIALLSCELNLLGHLIEDLIGVTCVEDVLEKVFSQFCIGK